MLSGRIVGACGKTTWNLEFDIKLPAAMYDKALHVMSSFLLVS
jgi:hypothetical protein